MTMEKRIRSLTALILAGMVLALAAGFMAGKKQTFSENENRYLAGFPHFTWERAVSGAYMEDWSSYLADQFPFRDFFVGAKTGMEYALGKREINQVFFAGDGYLIEEYAAPVNTDRIAAALHNFAEELESLQLEPRLMLVPTAYHVYREKLPAHVSWRDQMETAQTLYDASGMVPIDCSRALLTCEEEGLYYKTDHHWTSRGAFQGYLKWCEANGMYLPASQFHPVQVSDSFQGSLDSRVLEAEGSRDSIELFTREQEPSYTVSYNFGREISDSVYAPENLKKKDQYQIFLNGNHPEVTIETSNKNGKRLLIVKDSFANTLVPFLIGDCESIHLIDLRYYRGSLEDYISQREINEFLILYNLKNFCGEKNLKFY